MDPDHTFFFSKITHQYFRGKLRETQDEILRIRLDKEKEEYEAAKLRRKLMKEEHDGAKEKREYQLKEHQLRCKLYDGLMKVFEVFFLF